MMRRALIAVPVLVLAMLFCTAAMTPQERCAATKRKGVGKALRSTLGCYATAKRTVTGVDAGCITKVDVKLGGALTKAGTECPGDADWIGALIDSCVGALLADVPGDGKCPGTSTKALGRAAN